MLSSATCEVRKAVGTGALDTAVLGRGLQAHLAVALNALEVIHDGNAQARQRVENRQHHDIGRQRAENGLPGPPVHTRQATW